MNDPVLYPIALLRPYDNLDAVYVFNGQHRLAAAHALGLTHVPVVPATRIEDAVYAEDIFG